MPTSTPDAAIIAFAEAFISPWGVLGALMLAFAVQSAARIAIRRLEAPRARRSQPRTWMR